MSDRTYNCQNCGVAADPHDVEEITPDARTSTLPETNILRWTCKQCGTQNQIPGGQVITVEESRVVVAKGPVTSLGPMSPMRRSYINSRPDNKQ